jgi:hypothetical protein
MRNAMNLRSLVLCAFLIAAAPSAWAGVCDNDAPPECFDRGPVGSTYVGKEANGTKTKLVIREDRTVTFSNSLWGAPGGTYVFSRDGVFDFQLLLVRGGCESPLKVTPQGRFQITEKGTRVEQRSEDGKLIRVLVRQEPN